jgi:peptide deformylase
LPGPDVQHDLDEFSIIHYPDPRLRQRCETVDEVDGDLAALADRMFELMYEQKGVGLAASQVGVLKRLFVVNMTGEEKDRQVFVNPVLRDRQGSVEAEEGCLSLPGVNVNVRRSKRCRIEAHDLQGNPLELEAEDLVCRCWQHELDHLDGVLITDRTGPSDRMAVRKVLRSLEEGYGSHRK